MSLKRMLGKARLLASSGRIDKAMALIGDLIEEYPEESDVWSLRGHLDSLQFDYVSGEVSFSRALELDSSNPYLLFRRGIVRLSLAKWALAMEDFSEGLKLRDEAYEGAFYLGRSEALVAQGKKKEALADLAYVADGTKMWTYRLCSKEELLKECIC